MVASPVVAVVVDVVKRCHCVGLPLLLGSPFLTLSAASLCLTWVRSVGSISVSLVHVVPLPVLKPGKKLISGTCWMDHWHGWRSFTPPLNLCRPKKYGRSSWHVSPAGESPWLLIWPGCCISPSQRSVSHLQVKVAANQSHTKKELSLTWWIAMKWGSTTMKRMRLDVNFTSKMTNISAGNTLSQEE